MHGLLLALEILALLILITYIFGGVTYILQQCFLKIPTIKTGQKALREVIPTLGITEKDTIIDLGSGNGDSLFLFERMTGARTIGYELGLIPIIVSKLRKYFGKYRTKIIFGDFLKADLNDATVIYTYLFPFMMKKLSPKLQFEIARGAMVISCDFPLPIEPTETRTSGRYTFYLYRA